MATSELVRGEGIGKQLIEFAIEKLKQMNVETLWCYARIKATGFYDKMGFKTLGDVYDVPEIGLHKLMVFEVSSC
jgi:predicted GNAT family N-acyltransferase